MHDLLDDWAQCNALRETSAHLKLFLGLGAIIICVSSVTPPAPVFVAALTGIPRDGKNLPSVQCDM